MKWIKNTIRKWAWLGVLDFCLDCKMFIHSARGHKGHMVVRIKEVKMK